MRRALLFLLIAACAFSAAYDPVVFPDLGAEFYMLIALVAVAFIALAYMGAQFFESPQLVAWTKTQLRELFAGVILAILVAALFVFWGEFFINVMGEPVGEYTAGVIDQNMVKDALFLYGKVGDAYYSVSSYSGISLSHPVANFYYVILSGSEAPFSGISPLLQGLGAAGQQLTTVILAYKALKILVLYFGDVIPSNILPIALAFRIFPFTSRLGNTLIALCAAAYIFLPMGIILSGEFYQIAMDDYHEGTSLNAIETGNNGGPVSFNLAYSEGNFVYNELMDVCKEEWYRVLTALGEIPLGIGFATLACLPSIATLGGYFACWAGMFNLFLFTIWPLVMFVMQNSIGWAILAFSSPSSDAIYTSFAEPVLMYIFPAVAELNAMSIFIFLVVFLIVSSGFRAVSTALGGETVMYGVSRFM